MPREVNCVILFLDAIFSTSLIYFLLKRFEFDISVEQMQTNEPMQLNFDLWLIRDARGQYYHEKIILSEWELSLPILLALNDTEMLQIRFWRFTKIKDP